MRAERRVVDEASFVLKLAAGICSEAGFVAVAKEMLLAFVAIAE